jgi:holin-like protein
MVGKALHGPAGPHRLKGRPLIVGFGVLLGFQLVGEVISFWIGQQVPGPVIGMALFVVAALLFARRRSFQAAFGQTTTVAEVLLANLGMLFVPAGVGIIQQMDLVATRGVALAVILVVSTTLTLAVTVWTFVLVKRWLGSKVIPA